MRRFFVLALLVSLAVAGAAWCGYQCYWGFSIPAAGGARIGPFCLRRVALIDYGDGVVNYLTYDDCWRVIMLPGTEFGFTVYDGDGKRVGESGGKRGHPTALADVKDLARYAARTTILDAAQYRDGCWAIHKRQAGDRPDWSTWTVWTDEFYQAVRQAQAVR